MKNQDIEWQDLECADWIDDKDVIIGVMASAFIKCVRILTPQELKDDALFLKSFSELDDEHRKKVMMELAHRKISLEKVNELIATVPSKKKGQIKKTNSGPVFVSLYIDKEKKRIAEQIFKDNVSQFVIYENETQNICYADHYESIYPLENEAITKKCVLLATGVEEFGSLPALITELQEFIHKYTDVSLTFEKFAVFYILLSYLYDKINTCPYLRVLGDTGTGKTRFTDVVGKLCYKPMLIAGALNPAPVFRLIEMFKGTLIVEEADLSNQRQQSDETQAIIKIFNCGFEKNKPVVRCNPNDVAELNYFDVYCPKVLATRQRFQDQATESRCLTEIMRPTQRKDIPTNLLADFYIEQEKLRNKLLLFRLKNYFGFEQKKLHLQDMDIEPRLKQAYEAFACLFAYAPEILDEFKAFLVAYNKEIIEERADSFDGQIVNHLFDLINEGEAEITTKQIAERMGADIKPATIGRRLKPLGLKTKLKRDEKVKRIIELEQKQLDILKKRYVTDATDVTDVTEGVSE